MQVGQSSENDSDTDLEPEGIILLLQLFLDIAAVDFTYPFGMDGFEISLERKLWYGRWFCFGLFFFLKTAKQLKVNY